MSAELAPECSRRPFDSEEAARAASESESEWLKRLPRPVFPCPTCGAWHLGRDLGAPAKPCTKCSMPVVYRSGMAPVDPGRGWLHTKPKCKRYAREHELEWPLDRVRAA